MSGTLNPLNAGPRTGSGKGASHRLRAQGMIPAVLYGKGSASRNLVLRPEDVAHGLTRGDFQDRLAELVVDEGEGRQSRFKVRLQSVQQDPVSLKPIHVDLLLVEDEPAGGGSGAPGGGSR